MIKGCPCDGNWLRQEEAEFQKANFPLYSDSDINLIVSSRIDNKADLGRILNLSEKEPDCCFIAAAYHKWGKKVCESHYRRLDFCTS